MGKTTGMGSRSSDTRMCVKAIHVDNGSPRRALMNSHNAAAQSTRKICHLEKQVRTAQRSHPLVRDLEPDLEPDFGHSGRAAHFWNISF
jgi:hypothetical protein